MTTAPARIGRYEIIRRLGKSMTEVYLAVDTVENRNVALKLIKTDSSAVTRLVLEAERRGASIQQQLHAHDPRVVEIYDLGDVDGYFYVAMEYIEGRSLAEVLQAEQTIEPFRAAAIALEICEQLSKLHSWQTNVDGPTASVVHGDVKPSNIHLGMHDTVRLLDFGIAKTLRADHDSTVHNFGSPSYCSPERLSRSLVDQQSDLWAVGATLYEMLAGVPPYQAENTRKLESLIRSKRPPRALPAICPQALRTIVAKALASTPERRYRGAREFQEDLQAFLEHRPTLAERERRTWSPNATLEAARAQLRKATRTLGRYKNPIRIAGAAAWFFVGMGLWIGGSFAWQAWQARHRPLAPHPVPRVAVPPQLIPASAPAGIPDRDGLRAAYLTSAAQVFAAYRGSSEPSLRNFDWQKAEVCMERAVDLGASDDQTLGKLALSRGYAALERLAGGRYSESAAAQLRLTARDQFTLAAQRMLDDPDPHLALARLYVYSLPNVDRAVAEFRTAERLGHPQGRREVEQEGDAYRYRAQREITDPRLRRKAATDIAAARRLYRRIPGYDRADQHLRELEAMQAGSKRKPKLRRQARWR